jgi:2-isopropylmalate synthase
MAYVELSFENGTKTWGSGKSSNIGRAGIKAIISAVNRSFKQN